MARKLLWCLSGPAFNLAQQTDTVAEDGNSNYFYTTLSDALLHEYCPPNYELVLHNKLRRSKIGHKQSIKKCAEYLTELDLEIICLSKLHRGTLAHDITL